MLKEKWSSILRSLEVGKIKFKSKVYNMKKRVLKYASSNYEPLGKNKKHQFAAAHALNIYSSNTIYSFIPKNACTTMRLSLALENGCIQSIKDFNWIHRNNATFSASLRNFKQLNIPL